MSSNELNRRDFHRLSMAAMGGVMAGSLVGCETKPAVPPAAPPTAPVSTPTPPAVASTDAVAVEKQEWHLCRGLNECKGKGGGEAKGKNECAGLGECASVKEHACGGENECKGQGGCGANAAENECKGKGGCHIPLMDEPWTKVRKKLEEKMKTAGKKLGDAPPKKKSA
ncbi:MAG: hypothetical protein JWN70_4541 [Planctomycetaceae bacterium]|nr:hypothetical protein [Planctomycetaceae bacterium]